ncbi:MAG: tetratricopeptide repeat protein [Candidatus Micrarchaeota archaeon]|nr:tetratricopeptide repeat protein [Candidatus Micrarchaeota archaeon]
MNAKDCIRYFQLKKYDESAKCFESLLKQNPESEELNYSFGVALFETGQYFRAANFLKKANAIKEDSLTIYYIGLCYFNLLDFDSAEYFFKKSIEKKHDFAESYFMLGLCSLNKRDIESFNKNIKRAILFDKKKAKNLAIKFMSTLESASTDKEIISSMKKLLGDVLN